MANSMRHRPQRSRHPRQSDPDHRSATAPAQFLSWFDEFAAGSEALVLRTSERTDTARGRRQLCFLKNAAFGGPKVQNASDEICVRSRRSAGAAGSDEHNLILTARLPAAVAIFDVIASCDPADPVTAASQVKRAETATSGSSTRTARGWAWCTCCSPPRMPIRAMANTGATASKSHRFLAKVPAPRHRVPTVPSFWKMRVQAATRTFTDVGATPPRFVEILPDAQGTAERETRPLRDNRFAIISALVGRYSLTFSSSR